MIPLILTWFFGLLAWELLGLLGNVLLYETSHRGELDLSSSIAGLLLGPIALVLSILIFITEGFKK